MKRGVKMLLDLEQIVAATEVIYICLRRRRNCCIGQPSHSNLQPLSHKESTMIYLSGAQKHVGILPDIGLISDKMDSPRSDRMSESVGAPLWFRASQQRPEGG